MTDNTHHQVPFLPCRSCGRDKVINPGDYCRDCAVDPYAVVAMDSYIIVEPNTLADTAEKTGVAPAYLKSKYDRVHTMECQYVLFFAHGIWQDIVVDRKFFLPRVMQTVLERYK